MTFCQSAFKFCTPNDSGRARRREVLAAFDASRARDEMIKCGAHREAWSAQQARSNGINIPSALPKSASIRVRLTGAFHNKIGQYQTFGRNLPATCAPTVSSISLDPNPVKAQPKNNRERLRKTFGLSIQPFDRSPSRPVSSFRSISGERKSRPAAARSRCDLCGGELRAYMGM